MVKVRERLWFGLKVNTQVMFMCDEYLNITKKV